MDILRKSVCVWGGGGGELNSLTVTTVSIPSQLRIKL